MALEVRFSLCGAAAREMVMYRIFPGETLHHVVRHERAIRHPIWYNCYTNAVSF